MKLVMGMDDDEGVPLQTDLMPLKCIFKMVKMEKLYKGMLRRAGEMVQSEVFASQVREPELSTMF